MYKLLVLVLVLIYSVCPGSSRYMKYGRTQRLCGNQISETIKILCNGNLYEPPELKKSLPVNYGSVIAENSDDVFNSLDTLPFPFVSKAKSVKFLNNRQKRTDRIVDECCTYKSCSIDELRDYCAE